MSCCHPGEEPDLSDPHSSGLKQPFIPFSSQSWDLERAGGLLIPSLGEPTGSSCSSHPMYLRPQIMLCYYCHFWGHNSTRRQQKKSDWVSIDFLLFIPWKSSWEYRSLYLQWKCPLHIIKVKLLNTALSLGEKESSVNTKKHSLPCHSQWTHNRAKLEGIGGLDCNQVSVIHRLNR